VTDTTTPAVDCNADLDHPCDADDGEPCPRCKEEEAYWRRQWERTGRAEHAQAQTYRQDMTDAGRGHLLRESDPWPDDGEGGV
jgi:hypothetical protein